MLVLWWVLVVVVDVFVVSLAIGRALGLPQYDAVVEQAKVVREDWRRVKAEFRALRRDDGA